MSAAREIERSARLSCALDPRLGGDDQFGFYGFTLVIPAQAGTQREKARAKRSF
jgi:hypothetical protein